MGCAGRLVAADRAVVAGGAAPTAESGSTQVGRPRCVVWDLVRALHRDSMGVPAPGVGVRVGHDLLAAAGRVERSRGVGPAAPSAVDRVACGWGVGLLPG